ncbi:MAG: hypothetical protein KatS3mg008_1924 [Acidimicrobiales bacterium]|nr:MAG: hypothetical protein KatS3mg008_1924 [Acidimicrobiales bacterium]
MDEKVGITDRLGVAEPLRLVSVVGGSSVDDVVAGAAHRLGGLLAGEGFAVVTGGRTGVAEAVCRGAVENGGLTIGLLPSTDPGTANPWVLVRIPTGLGDARNSLVAAAGEVVVAFPGGWGTRSEVALAGVHGRPVIVVGDWLEPDTGSRFVRVPDPEAALVAVRRVLATRGD